MITRVSLVMCVDEPDSVQVAGRPDTDILGGEPPGLGWLVYSWVRPVPVGGCFCRASRPWASARLPGTGVGPILLMMAGFQLRAAGREFSFRRPEAGLGDIRAAGSPRWGNRRMECRDEMYLRPCSDARLCRWPGTA
jgi:hypothetical protein